MIRGVAVIVGIAACHKLHIIIICDSSEFKPRTANCEPQTANRERLRERLREQTYM